VKLATGALSDRVDGILDRILTRHIGLDVVEFAGVLGLQSGKVLLGAADVEREDLLSIIGQTDLGQTETNTLVGTGDCGVDGMSAKTHLWIEDVGWQRPSEDVIT
jgi:hypothetical protein